MTVNSFPHLPSSLNLDPDEDGHDTEHDIKVLQFALALPLRLHNNFTQVPQCLHLSSAMTLLRLHSDFT